MRTSSLNSSRKRLDQRHAHVFGQPADVVVRLDHVRLARIGTRRFDDVGIDRALRQPLDILELARFLVEIFDELAADDLALLLRVLDAFERLEEALRRVDADDVDAEVFGKRLHDLIAFAVPQQPVIDEHANKLIADRLVQQRRYDRRIDAARQAEQTPCRRRPVRARWRWRRRRYCPASSRRGSRRYRARSARSWPAPAACA